MKRLLSWLTLLTLVLPVSAAKPKPLQKFENCTLVPTEWADGDSFRIKTATGEEHTIRLYGVDCIELHTQTETNQRRLREQRRYFGITDVGGSPLQSIAIAKEFANKGKVEAMSLLAKPFTIHTRFKDAMGDPRYKRIYAIVTCADGKDLGSDLVRAGLARAWGYDSDYPDGKSSKQSESMLRDLELVAAKRGFGVWAKTDWDKLLAERDTERNEAMENKASEEN